MTFSVGDGQIHRRAGLWWTFPLHQIVSTVGIAILSYFFTFAPTPSQARWILTETHYFPVQLGVAFFTGFILHHYLRHRVMQWVWVLPLLFLCVSFGRATQLLGERASFGERALPFSERLDFYFGTACRPEDRRFVQLGITAPFYIAASYSLGAFLSRTILQRKKQQHETAK